MSWTTGKITTATTEGGKDKNYNKILAQMLLKECSNVECPIVTVMILLKVG